jgi:transketolase
LNQERRFVEIKQQVRKSNEMRQDIIRMIANAGSGHPGGSLSCIDILNSLYFGGVLNHDPSNPKLESRDWFIMAKGHAAPALYAVLAHSGYFPVEELLTLRKLGTRLQGHPDANLVPGVEVSTGSLGQGLSVACGVACGHKLDGNPARVFCLLGDGECEEGQVWEAAMFAAHKKLGNLIAIVDHNGLQIDGNISDVCSPENFAEKFAAFGWNVTEVDGHNIEALNQALSAAKANQTDTPQLILAQTVKGKGVSFMENQAGWHGKAPNAEEVETALAELNAEVLGE